MTPGEIKTVAGAVICGTGVTAGIVVSPMAGPVAWLVAGAMVVLGFGVAAVPLRRRS